MPSCRQRHTECACYLPVIQENIDVCAGGKSFAVARHDNEAVGERRGTEDGRAADGQRFDLFFDDAHAGIIDAADNIMLDALLVTGLNGLRGAIAEIDRTGRRKGHDIEGIHDNLFRCPCGAAEGQAVQIICGLGPGGLPVYRVLLAGAEHWVRTVEEVDALRRAEQERLGRDLLVAASHHTASERIAQVLANLSREVGRKGFEGTVINISNEDLANEANVTIFTVSRTLNEWQRKGLVLKRRGQVVLRSPEKLVG